MTLPWFGGVFFSMFEAKREGREERWCLMKLIFLGLAYQHFCRGLWRAMQNICIRLQFWNTCRRSLSLCTEDRGSLERI